MALWIVVEAVSVVAAGACAFTELEAALFSSFASGAGFALDAAAVHAKGPLIVRHAIRSLAAFAAGA
jgi:hypothetical protein